MRASKLAYFQYLYDHAEPPSNDYDYEIHVDGICDECGNEFNFQEHDSIFCIYCDKHIIASKSIKTIKSDCFKIVPF